MSAEHILVIGSGGYIGSHMVLTLLEAGYRITSLDNFSTGFRDAILGGEIIEADLEDMSSLRALFAANRFDAVMHFASSIQVSESVTDPAKYYRNNVVNTLNLLDGMRVYDVNCLVFSSSAAVYGEPDSTPITESHPLQASNPYGRSKWMVERILADFDVAYGLRSVSLRYFNAAGADPQGRLGERHEPETHLIPNLLRVASGRNSSAKIFGKDYPTPDGTCIRDYVHVSDLCDAHLLALQSLLAGCPSKEYNLGSGCGFSVLEVVECVRRISGKDFPVQEVQRRPGDPARLVASSDRIADELGWKPRFAQLDRIVEHAWRWELRQQ